jgi:acetylornithine deacetylase/succinyl-diaminopimelate desuccinylase-like protein
MNRTIRAVCAAVTFGAAGLNLAHAGQTASGPPVPNVSELMSVPQVQAALQSAREQEGATIDEQVRICEVPAPSFKEGPRAELMRRAFEQLGLQNVRLDSAGNVLGDRPGGAPRPRLVLAAHLDTVFSEGTDVKVTRKGSALVGPGTGDNCRGLAVLLAVVRAMNAADVRTPATVTFVANVGEEGLGDLRGMKALFDQTMKGQIDRFVAIDNAGINITIMGIGSRRYRVTFKGPGGHSLTDFGQPNPADALGRAIAKIAELRVPSNPKTTFNVGRIGGGTAVNAIPSEAWMEVDLRSETASALAALDAQFRRAVDAGVAEENARWGRNTVTVVKELVGDRPAGQTPEDAPIVRIARDVADALGLDGVLSAASSDANLPMSRQIPAIAIGGGGRSYGSHAPGEWFDASESWKGTQNALLLTIALAR